MYCTNCGRKIDNDVKFCSRCGAPIQANNEFANEKEYSLFSTNGRIGRRDYALLTGIYFLLSILLFIISYIAYESVLDVICIFALLCIGIFQNIILFVKRLHDFDISGYWWFLFFFLNLITCGVLSYLVAIVFCCIPGTEGVNRFGKVQKFF